MTRTRKRRIASWQADLVAASPFVILCGVVAVCYFVYRIILLAYPVEVLEHEALHTATTPSVVCAKDEGSSPTSSPSILSLSYQNRIAQLNPLGGNLVMNPDMTDIDQNAQVPKGYVYNVANATSDYQYLHDRDGSPFLRITDTRKTGSPSQITPAWLPDPVPVTPENTYAYSFQYRSTIPVQVALERTAAVGGKVSDASIVTLNPTSSWQSFTAHFNNTDNDTSFRVVITGVSPGRIDSRKFNVHEIPSAELPNGMVSVTFDDGWESTAATAAALLAKYHILTTQYIISEVAASGVPEYMDYNAILSLKQAGNEIGSHTLTHCDQTTLSSTAIQNNAIQSKQMLEAHSLGPIESFAYPLGQYNDTTQAIYSKQYPFIRTSDVGYNDRYFDETNIHSMAVLSTTKASTVQSWLAYAKVHHLWLVLVYHQVNGSGEYNVTSTQLDQQLNMVSRSGLTVLPLAAAGKEIRGTN
jgi:peptidoglycan/xylan/chitin deacetylase (PgdA/CDA1 family)